MSKGKANAYSGLADVMSDMDDLMVRDSDIVVQIKDIKILPQIRTRFETPEDPESLRSLGDSLVKRQLHAIGLRPNDEGGPEPWILIFGERRCRGAGLVGLDTLRGRVFDVNADEARQMQLAENIQRENLQLVEEAIALKADLDRLGSRAAVLDYHDKRGQDAWLSKRLSLLALPEQAHRLVTERVTSDIEAINNVKQIEKADPSEAKKLVDRLKDAPRGKVNVRAETEKVRAKLKPPKAEQARSPAEPDTFSGEKKDPRGTVRPAHEGALANAYQALYEQAEQPKAVLKSLDAAEREAVENYLSTFYEAGKQAVDAARTVVEGFRNGGFATDGVGAFALVAYLHGADRNAKFSVLNVFGCLKP